MPADDNTEVLEPQEAAHQLQDAARRNQGRHTTPATVPQGDARRSRSVRRTHSAIIMQMPRRRQRRPTQESIEGLSRSRAASYEDEGPYRNVRTSVDQTRHSAIIMLTERRPPERSAMGQVYAPRQRRSTEESAEGLSHSRDGSQEGAYRSVRARVDHTLHSANLLLMASGTL